jgi:hypothetical protein
MNSYVTINGKKYEVPQMDFNTVVELEENGVSLLAMNEDNPKIATMLRAFVAWIMNTSAKKAGQEIQKHLMNGGNLVDLITVLTEALESSGFSNGSRPQPSKVERLPQDHQKGQKNKNRSHEKNTSQSQTS